MAADVNMAMGVMFSTRNCPPPSATTARDLPPATQVGLPWLLCLFSVFLLPWISSCASGNGCHRLPRLLGQTPESRLQDALERCEKHWTAAAAGKPASQLLYDVACRQLLCELRTQAPPKEWAERIRVATAGKKQLTATIAGDLRLDRIDDILPANDRKKSPENQGFLGRGFGTPVVARMKYRAEAAVPAKLFPPQGRHLPATVTVDFSKKNSPVLRVVDTLATRSVEVGKKATPLAVDYLTPLRQNMTAGRFGEFFSLPRLFRPQQGLEEVGIYSMTPYRKGRVPVVFIHGLESDPSTWLEAMHKVWSTPELSDRYQVWYFLYPTGLPIPESAERLRKALAAAVQTYDPKNEDPALRRMILVGHSMGGVLSHWQVVNTGTSVWQEFFPKATPATLPVRPNQRAALAQQLHFKANPNIERVIFIATPHRGSEVANRLPDWLVRLIKLPFHLTDLTLSLATLDENLLNPVLRKFHHSGMASLETLRADWPGNAAINRLPIQATHHSIIAKLNKLKPLESSTDGAVPYTSSRVATAKSEKVVHAWHSCCRNAEVVEEVARILKEVLATPRKP